MNRIFNVSSESMKELPDESVHLSITSPPYNVGKEYEAEQSFQDWLELCGNVFKDVHRVLIDGGRFCVNVANVGRSPYRPLNYHVVGILMQLGFLLRGEIIWDKGASVGPSTAWGSWKSASNPSLRDVHEYVIVASKGTMKRQPSGENTIDRDEFLSSTRSIWKMNTESAKRVGHPSSFPLELPKRLIQLYSFKGDTVLDPFCGSGTSCAAAVMLGRRYIGYDTVPEYCELARRRVREAESTLRLGVGQRPAMASTA